MDRYSEILDYHIVEAASVGQMEGQQQYIAPQ
jgi:hypothetical protein